MVRSLHIHASINCERLGCPGLLCVFSTAWSTSLCRLALISWFSTFARTYSDATANNALRPKPNSANEISRRKRSLRLDCIRIDHAVTDAVPGVDQGLFERLVDRSTQAVDVYAQAVAVGQLLAPHLLLQVLPGDHRGARLHQRLQQLQADRIELDRLAV